MKDLRAKGCAMRDTATRLFISFSRPFTAKRGTARRLVLSLAGLCVVSMIAPASAQLLGRKILSNPEPGAATTNPKLINYISGLAADARAAAERGDLDKARTLAQRAHKLSLTCQAILADHPECSPAATEVLAKEFSLAKSSPSLQNDKERLADSAEDDEATAPQELDASPTRLALRTVAIDPLTALRSEDRPPLVIAKRPAPKAPIPYVPAQKTADRKATLVSITPLRLPAELWPTPQPTDGFLTLQAKWLSPDIASQALVDELPTPPREPFPSERTIATLRGIPVSQYIQLEPSPAEVDPRPEPIERENTDFPGDEMESSGVTTALGVSEDEGEPEAGDDTNNAIWETPPRQAPSSPRDSAPPEENQIPRRDRAAESSPLGVWVAGAANSASGTGEHNAVTPTDYRDVVPGETVQASGQFDIALAPQAIETMLRSSPEPNPFSQSAGEAIPAEPHSPLVICHEDDAADWLPSESAAETKAASLGPIPYLSERAVANPVVISGFLLVVGGLLLFSLSFRREPGR
jgi:hypothetical protein